MTTTISSVRLEQRDDQWVPVAAPRLSWITTSDIAGWRQAGAELEWWDGEKTTVVQLDSNESALVKWPFADLLPRQRGRLKLRVRGPDGWSGWSELVAVAAAFLGPGEWQARFIGLKDPENEQQPVLLRHEFAVGAGLSRATLFATAQGVYQAWINGQPVDDQVLKPGWTPFEQRLIHETTDVTALILPGDNAIAVALAGGWFTERYGFGGLAQRVYGTQPAFAGQLLLEYADGRLEWITSAADWQGSADGPWLSAGIYDGETYDARRACPDWSRAGFPAAGWELAEVRPGGPVPEPRSGPETRVIERLPVTAVLTSEPGRVLLDFGQNLVGRLRLRLKAEAGTVLRLRHAEVLENGGLAVRPLRAAKATDCYILAGGGEEEWAPSFTFHGFRYAELTGFTGDFDPAMAEAEVIGSDMRRTGWFECSDPLVSYLHDNVIRSMRGNFLYLPTDCPQRDERLGWTGDIQMFGPTATYLYDCSGLLASWLTDLAIEQAGSRSVPLVVPNVLDGVDVPAAAWGDAAVILPWVLYQRFGDFALLERQYPSMKAWTDQILALAGKRHLWEDGFQFGDWVDPDAPPDQPARAKTDPDLVANAYLYRSTQLLAQTAGLLGQAEAAQFYAAEAESVRQAWLAQYVTPAGRVLSDTQTGYSLAIEFGLATGALAQTMGERLAWLVRRDGYHISTGFVGTPLVTSALTSTGHLAQAGRMVQQTECPSWLYPVTMGATTIWERWDSLLEDGSVNPGDMTSFNHYALGAIADWLHRVVAGLGPAAPGYQRLLIAPQPLPGLTWASTRHETPYGPATCQWRREGEWIVVEASVPPNAAAEVRLPGGDEFEVGAGRYEWRVAAPAGPEFVPLTSASPLAQILDDPEAYRLVMETFARVDPAGAHKFLRRTSWVTKRPLFGDFSQVSAAVVSAVADCLAGLNQRRGLG